MDKAAVVDEIIKLEWTMFHNVNGETRANCQEDPLTFRKMRGAQYEVWDPEVCESYLEDLRAAESEGSISI